MRDVTVSSLDAWYGRLFDIDADDVWRRITACFHKGLGDSPGYYVAWRGKGVHVSVPHTADPATARSLSSEAVEVLQSIDFWQDFAVSRGLQVVGPSTHSYLDADPGPVDGVCTVDRSALAALRGRVDDQDWAESGWQDAPARTFGLYDNGTLAAASNLNVFDGLPRDIGVLVAPPRRGRGLSETVGRHAASYAIRQHGFARWGTRNANTASLAAARRLGFEAWCTQLWVR
ncbi:MAG: GNAT family N-acetyltransferase [Propionibacteriales bacterium]|nr:GNAT family N-acetyltransferase [Propionibacteriales bacterium]